MRASSVMLTTTLVCFALFVILLSYRFWPEGVFALVLFWTAYFAFYAVSYVYAPKVYPKVYRMTSSGIYVNGGFFSWNGFRGYRVGEDFVYLIGSSGKEVMALPKECENVIRDHLSRF